MKRTQRPRRASNRATTRRQPLLYVARAARRTRASHTALLKATAFTTNVILFAVFGSLFLVFFNIKVS